MTTLNRRRISMGKNLLSLMRDNIICVRAAGGFNGISGWRYSFEPGKSYRIIAKIKNLPSSGKVCSLYVYKTNANSPAVWLHTFQPDSEQIAEIIYTHGATETYAYIGSYTSDSQNGPHDIVMYIEELK